MPLTTDRRTQRERRSQPLHDADETVECVGCGSRPLASSALGLVIIRPGAHWHAPTTWWCPRCARRFARCFYGLA